MTVRRVLVAGGPGSGKTTFARTVAGRTDLPHTDLDRIAYQPPPGHPDAPFPRWTRVPDDRRTARAATLAATGTWVADGLYAGWTGPLRDAAEIIVRLDPPPRVAAWRVLRRAAEDRRRGGPDWDARSVLRVLRGSLGYRSRPAAPAAALRERDGANSSRTLAQFLQPVPAKVIRCRTAADVRRALERLTA